MIYGVSSALKTSDPARAGALKRAIWGVRLGPISAAKAMPWRWYYEDDADPGWMRVAHRHGHDAGQGGCEPAEDAGKFQGQRKGPQPAQWDRSGARRANTRRGPQWSCPGCLTRNDMQRTTCRSQPCGLPRPMEVTLGAKVATGSNAIPLGSRAAMDIGKAASRAAWGQRRPEDGPGLTPGRQTPTQLATSKADAGACRAQSAAGGSGGAHASSIKKVIDMARTLGASDETVKLLTTDAAKAAESLPVDRRPLGARYDSARAKVAKATSRLDASTERVRVALEEQEAADAASFVARQQLAEVEAEVAHTPGPDVRITASQADAMEQLLLAIAAGTLGPEDASKASTLAHGLRGRQAEEEEAEGEHRDDTDMEQAAVDVSAEAQEVRVAAEQSLQQVGSCADDASDVADAARDRAGADARRHEGSRTPPRQCGARQACSVP